MNDTQILTIAIALIVPVSTLFAGISVQDTRAGALRSEVVDALKQIKEEIGSIRTDLRDEHASLRTEFREDMKELRAEVREIRSKLA